MFRADRLLLCTHGEKERRAHGWAFAIWAKIPPLGGKAGDITFPLANNLGNPDT